MQPTTINPRTIWRSFRSLVTNRLTWPEADFLVNHERKLIYCPIAKVACSSIKRWFLALAGEHVPEDASIHKAARRHRMREQSALLALRALRDPRYFKFTLVRNPWSRLVSAYLNKFLRVNSCSTRFAEEMSRGSLPPRDDHGLVQITFAQFVQHLAASNPARYDVHWRPQYLYLTGHRFDFVGRFEHLSDDFADLQRKLGTSAPLPRCKTTRYAAEPQQTEIVADLTPSPLIARGPLPDYRWFYTPALREIVERIYAPDIQLWNYEFAAD
jgi:hypothetical protein